ncbi:serine protease inhibitor dipetalogastin-like [Dendropsophus ebraccatus]|uniref:serine protease inhibitor dipetalogastin-like n=1 Tax=Dendropsophus ebraccatus TaxID=150705 RepID=UPI0038312C82
MKPIGIIVYAIVAFTCFKGIICSSGDVEIEPNCDGYIPIPGIGLACNRMRKPVCGTNGRTYSNECELCSHIMRMSKSEDKIKIKYRQECTDEDGQLQDECHGFGNVCPRLYKPVCGSDAVTYPNKCSFCNAKKRNVDLLLVSEGRCEPKDEQVQDECQIFGNVCPRLYKPVCGSDAVTYPNKCSFCSAKKSKASLLLVSEGECEPKDECQGFGEICTLEYRPVCGSDAVTYPNKCVFCNAEKRNADLALVSEGTCESKDEQLVDECQGYGKVCPRIYLPVCGSDAVTYPNKCVFCSAKKRKANLVLVSEEKCEQKDEQLQDECLGFGEICTLDYRPVCGSDSHTYPNKCGFCGAKRRNAGLYLISEGECPQI